MVVNIHEAKTHLSQLLARVALGETITIAKDGNPVAQLVGIATQQAMRKPGLGQGRVWLADDWDSVETNNEIAGLFGMQLSEPRVEYKTRKPVKTVKAKRTRRS